VIVIICTLCAVPPNRLVPTSWQTAFGNPSIQHRLIRVLPRAGRAGTTAAVVRRDGRRLVNSGRRAAQTPAHFCPPLDDKISINANSTPTSRSIAAAHLWRHESLHGKPPKNAAFKTNIRFFLSPRKNGSLGVSRSVSYSAATKPPHSVAFQRFSNIRDKIPAPQSLDPIHICATQLQ
jgi:hypothetical protein